MDDDHIERHQQIDHRHEGHDDFGDAGDLLDAAENDHAGQRRQRNANPQLVETKGALERIGDGIGLDGVEDETEGQDQADRENGARPGGTKPLGNIEGRPATIFAIVVLGLVELGQSGLRIGRRHADQRHHPHPEDRAGPAEIERHRHTGEIAGTDARGQRRAKRLERRDAGAVIALAAHNGAEHLAKMHKLDEAKAHREEQAHGQQTINEDVAPRKCR
jgi:hypothetical protein